MREASTGQAVELAPADHTIVRDDRWTFPDLGIAVPAPPTALRADAGSAELAAAHAAIDCGVAVTRPARSLRRRWASPVPVTRARRVPDGVVRVAPTVIALVGRQHLTSIAVLCAGAAAAAAAGLPALAHIAALSLLGLASIVVHESGHALVARLVGGKKEPLLVCCSGYRAAVIRRRLPGRRDALVTLAGPCAPAVVALACWPLVTLLPAEVIAGAIIAAGHLLGLAMPSSDRDALKAALAKEDQAPGAPGASDAP